MIEIVRNEKYYSEQILPKLRAFARKLDTILTDENVRKRFLASRVRNMDTNN